MAVIYFVLIRNKPKAKTDWETLPFLDEYEKSDDNKNDQGDLCCTHCKHSEFVTRDLQSEKENPDKTKHYHACTNCKVILWRSVEE